MKKFVLAVTVLAITASSALAQRYSSYDPDPNVRLEMAREANIGGG